MGYCVYCHTNLTNGKKYYGITRQAPEKRWQKGAGYKGTYFGNAIAKYGWDGFLHTVLFRDLSKEEACKIEIDLISKYKTSNRNFGYNVALGGQTCDVITGKSGENHPNHKRVKMIDAKTNEVIRVFGSQSTAAKELGISRKGITKACQGISCTYMGYVWEYADIEYAKPIHNGAGNYDHSMQRKPIIVIDIDGTEHHFKSINDASLKFGISHSNISRFLTGIRKDKSGRRWSYAFIESKAK